jgi:ferric enterobactin receptor
MRRFIFVLTIPFFFCTLASGETNTNTKLTGKVFDKSTMQPLEYATVSVINKQSAKVITGSVTDVRGAFGISDIPLGTYTIDIEFIGYEKITIDNISINNDKRSVSLGTVYLSPSTYNLQGVTVVGDKPVIENKIDKVVYNVSNDITSQGGLAIDVLKKVPQVTVDIDGNVELQGNSNIRFLINGKPSSVFGNNVSDALASIPASQIKSVEAITNPGAKYDSQGTGGIINIILQDNKMQGVNGNINLSAGSRLENGSANLNIRHNNFGINAFFSGNAQLKSQMPFSQRRVTTDTTNKEITTLSQTGSSDFERNGFRSGIGFDWNLSKNDNITGSLGYNQFSNRNQGPTSQEQLTEDYSNNPLSDIFTLRNSDSHMKISSFDWNLDYKKKFKKEGQELDIIYSASNGRPNTNYVQTQSYSGQSIPYTGSTSFNPGTNNETNISIDYSHPINESFIFETGAKTVIQKINSNADVSVFNPVSDQFLIDPLQSYNLNYTMKVYAGYLSANFPLFHYLNIKAGARYEYTNVNINFPNTSIPSYGTFVPSIVISHNFNKTQSLKLSYSKRIERPEYRELNPFINLSDPYNISTGNPLLKPEIGNNFEFGYTASFRKGGNLYLALIERINTQDIKQMTVFYPAYLIGDSTYTNVSVTKNQNVGSEYNSGISVSGSYPITSRLNLRGNLMATERYVVSNLSTGNISEGVRVRLNLNATYQLPKDLVLELFGMYSSATRNIQGKVPQFLVYNFAFRKMFWDKKASFGFTTINPFSKYVRQITTITTDNSTANNVRQMPLRSFGISFTYKFGKMEFKKNKEEDNSNFLDNTSSGAR